MEIFDIQTGKDSTKYIGVCKEIGFYFREMEKAIMTAKQKIEQKDES